MRNKLIAAGLGLVGYGAVLGWAITGDALDAKMKGNQLLLGDIIKKQAEDLKTTRELLLKSGYPTSSVGTVKPVVVEEEKPFEVDEPKPGFVRYDQLVPGQVDEQLRGETPEQTRTNLNGLIEGYTENPEDREAFVKMAAVTLQDTAPDNTPPFVISHQTYSWDEDEGDEYEKAVLTYYPDNQILLDDTDEPVEQKSIDGLVGWKNLDRFGDQSDSADTVYIRNRRHRTDYEVVRSYDELPLHVQAGLGKVEFDSRQAAGLTRFRRSDVGD